MIQPQELRIGNWISINGVPRYLSVLFLIDGIFVVSTLPNIFSSGYGAVLDPLHTAEPIPLSPSILEKCGFVKCKHYSDEDSFIRNGFFITLTSEWFQKDLGDGEAVIISYNVKYLHQLQNIIFSLTGTDLTISM